MALAKDFIHRDLISMRDLTKPEILLILDLAQKFKKSRDPDLLKGSLLATCFFEPSTRTRLSFEAAMKRLGGDVIGFSDSETTSIKKGESLFDCMKVMGQYADLIVIRHALEGSARLAAMASRVPVINGGDGANEHPTQTLLDLFSIRECQGKLEGLNIVLAGDLRFSRTMHSLAIALKYFDCRLFFVSPKNDILPDHISDELRRSGVQFSFHTHFKEVVDKADVIYMTRIQQERFADRLEYENIVNHYRLDLDMLQKAKETLRILHPLPRVHEIDKEIDRSPLAYYFEQSENGLYVRQAILALLLGKTL